MCISKPKVQPLPPVVERQAFRDPVSRASLGGSDPDARRRLIAGVMTGNAGVAGPASTTRNPGSAPATVQNTGGDQVIQPLLASSGGGSAAAPINVANLIPAIVTSVRKPSGSRTGFVSPLDRRGGGMARQNA